MRLWSVALLAFILAVPNTPAQQASVRETVEVRLIEIDAVVTDRDGNPITGLSSADFELFENGKPQSITNFSEYRETVETTASQPATTSQPLPATVSKPAPRTIVFFIDALPLRGPERVKLFDNLRALVARTMRPGDRAEVLRWSDQGGVRATTPLTTDRNLIEAAIKEAETNANLDAAGPAVQEYNEFFTAIAEADKLGRGRGTENMDSSKRFAAERELALMRRKTAAMTRVLSALAQPAGRSIFVYVSEAFPLVAGKRAATPRRAVADMSNLGDAMLRATYTTQAMLEAVIKAANANGVSLYALKPDRPWTSPVGSAVDDAQVVNNPAGGTEAQADNIVLQNEIASLSLVAEETGGTFGVGPQAAEEIVERIVRDVGSYYTLAYRAQSDGSDRTRRIEVRAKNPAHRVRSRSAIVEKSDRTRTRDLLVARLFENGPEGDLPFAVTTGTPVAAGKDRVRIPIELSIPAEGLRFEAEGTELAAKFTVLTVTGASLHTTGEISEQSKRITAPAGSTPQGAIRFTFPLLHDMKRTTVAIAVFDENSGLAGTRSIVLGSGVPVVATPIDSGSWTAALEQAQREKKPILVFEKPARKACNKWCAALDESLKHPAIQRRLPEVVYLTRTALRPGLAIFDRRGTQVALISDLPRDTTTLGTLIDALISVKPNLERATMLEETNGPGHGDLELAAAMIVIGRTIEARAAIDRAGAHGHQELREMAVVVRAMLDANEGKRDEALQALRTLTGSVKSNDVAFTAWMSIASLHRGAGELDDAIRAYTTAAEIAGPGNPAHATAIASLSALQALSPSAPAGAIRIVPVHQQLVTGRWTIRTNVSSTDVARVIFSLDGEERATVDQPPFSTRIDFGRIPQQRTIRAVAHDVRGAEIGRHELTVNHAGEMFWIRLIEPRAGAASGNVRMTATLRAPARRKVNRVVVSWNDVERAVITGEPWQTDVDIPNELGVLRAVAELEDGRTTEDAVLLNTVGHVEHADVPLVELPVTITENDGAPSRAAASDLIVREGRKERAIESVTSGADAPLTVGLVFDASGSMYKTLLDVQEAAIRFLETSLGPKDRAFFIAFNSTARLVQTPTSDVAQLREQIMAVRANGLTALHDAMILGLLQFEGVKGRRALIVFSDGEDRASRYQARDVAELARRSNIPIYLIAAREAVAGTSVLRPSNQPGPIRGPANRDPRAVAFGELIGVTRSTGGMTHHLESLAELPKTYEHIAATLRAQSLVVIRTDPGRNENDWRNIEVDVIGRKRDVRAPSGYYAPW